MQIGRSNERAQPDKPNQQGNILDISNCGKWAISAQTVSEPKVQKHIQSINVKIKTGGFSFVLVGTLSGVSAG